VHMCVCVYICVENNKQYPWKTAYIHACIHAYMKKTAAHKISSVLSTKELPCQNQKKIQFFLKYAHAHALRQAHFSEDGISCASAHAVHI
jgi:hypothetical protein